VIVSVEEPPAVTELGERLAVGPEGETLALKVTVCADPLVTAVLMVDVPLAPWATLTLLGLALMEKSFGGGVPPQLGNLKEAILVFQLNAPLEGMY
jgi:hypothetical protein